MENSSYTSYQGMMAKVDTALAGMETICGNLEMEEARKSLAGSREKLENHRFAVGIMGEFKRGKSTVINSLLEQEIMPADILPCSATMNRVTYDMQPHAELRMMDGTTRRISVDELASYVTKLNSDNESRAANVEEAVVYYPCRFCQNGVDIVDTPGLNDDERMNKISEETIPKLDAVIMVLVPDNPFSMSESEFVRNKLMSSDLGRLIFLVNKIDTIRKEEDRQKALDGIKDKIRKTVLKKMADMYGEDSAQYKDAQIKLGNIRVLPFSALDALEGKQSGDQKLIERSGTIPFEETLTKMLTEERGALELGSPINVLNRTALEVAKTIEARRSAMALSVEEFDRKREEALKQIQDLRTEKKEEGKRLKERSKAVQAELASRAAQFYPQLEQSMLAVVDNYNPDPKPFAKTEGQKQGAEELQAKVTAEMNDAVSSFSEKITVELQDIIGEEALSTAEFTSSFLSKIDTMRTNLAGKPQMMEKGDLVGTGVDILTDFVGIYGIGGIVAGFRAAGVKGAIAGGGVGLVANLAAASILASLSIVGLPMVMISCAIGTLVSKKFSETVFGADVGKKKLTELKTEMKKNVSLAIREMQVNRNLETWIEEMVVKRFDELIASMEDECEKMLHDSERSMDEIRKDLAKSEAERANTLKRLEDAENRCVALVKELQPICEKVEMVLKEVG